MVLLFYVDECLIFSPSKDRIDELYASIWLYFKIEYDGELNKYLEIELECRLDGSIHIMQHLHNPKYPQHDPRHGQVKG